MALWMLCGSSHPQIHPQASQACQVDQSIQAEFIYATAQQVIEPGLGNTKLFGLSEETQRLASLYERKLAALDALKKSLLHQAFTGEL